MASTVPRVMAAPFLSGILWLLLSISNKMTVEMWSSEPTAKAKMPVCRFSGIKAPLANNAPSGDMAAKMARQNHMRRVFTPEIFNKMTSANAAGM